MADRKNTFILKRSSIAGKVPNAGDLALGELAINTSDAILYASGTTAGSILPIGWDRVPTTGGTMTGPLIVPSVSATTMSSDTISIGGGELMGRIPNTLDYQLFGNQSSTGVIYYAGLSANTIDNSKFDLGMTEGWIVDSAYNPENPVIQHIKFTGSTDTNPSGITLTYLNTHPVTYIAISGNSISNIVQSTRPFNDSERRTMLELGVVVHSNNLTVNAINDHPLMGINPTQQFFDLTRGLGFFNVNGGNIFSENTGMTISKSVGKIFANGSNYLNDPRNPNIIDTASGTGLTFRYRLQDSTEWPDSTNVDPNVYDNGGVTALTPDFKFTVQRIALFTSNLVRIQYGQNIYDSLDDAEGSISREDFVTEQNIEENGLIRGFIIIRQGATDITDPTQARFVEANRFGDVGDTTVGGLHDALMQHNSSTGIIDGGILSIDAPTGETTFNITTGNGIIVDNTLPNLPIITEVNWVTQTGVTSTYVTNSAETHTYISINAGGSIVQTAGSVGLTQQQKRDEVIIGGLLHINGEIVITWERPTSIMSPISQIEDLTSSIGPFSISGNRLSKITGTLSLEKSLGEAFYFGGNFSNNTKNPSTITTDILSASTLVYASGESLIMVNGNEVDINNYDPDGLGVITAIGNNRFVAHRVWHQPSENVLVWQYGQFDYANVEDARTGIALEPYIATPVLTQEAYLIAVVICRENVTHLDDPSRSQIVPQGKFAGTGGGGSTPDTLQSAYNNSDSPEIITDSTRGAVDFVQGNILDNNVITTQNSGHTITSFIQGDGVFSANTTDANILYSAGTELSQIFTKQSAFSGDVLTVIGKVQDDPTGFENNTDSTISFDDATRVFTINGGPFSFYIRGKYYTRISDTLDLDTISAAEGLYFIYYDENGVITASTTFTDDIITEYAFIAAVYWDATNNIGKVFDERHGHKMPSSVHQWLHTFAHSQYVSGMQPSSITVNASGDLNSHAQFVVGTGILEDEDIQTTITPTTLTANDKQIYYFDSSNNVRWTTQSGGTGEFFPVLTTGTGRLAHNPIGGGLVEVVNNDFVLCHVIALNNGEYGFFVGQNEYNNISAARAGIQTEASALYYGQLELLSLEFVLVASLIYQTSNGDLNDVKARVRTLDTGEDYFDWRTTKIEGSGGVSVNDHTLLENLNSDLYTHLTGVEYSGLTGGGDASVYHNHNSLYSTTDYYTTGATIVNSTIHFDRNDALSAYSADISSIVGYSKSSNLSGWTASGDLFYADIVHNFNTKDLLVESYDIVTDKIIDVSEYEFIDINTLRVFVDDNTSSIRTTITVKGAGTELIIQGGEANTVSNSGAGAGLYKTKTLENLVFKSILTDANINLTEQTDTISFALTDLNLNTIAVTGNSILNGLTSTTINNSGLLTSGSINTSIISSGGTNINTLFTQNAFKTITSNGESDIVANGIHDSLEFSGINLSVITNPANNKITFSAGTGGGSALTVKEVDGTPTVNNVSTIRFTNGSVTDDGAGQVTITAGSSSGFTDEAKIFGWFMSIT